MTDHRKALRDAASQAARQAERVYKAENPDAAGLKVRADVAAYKPRAKEVRDAPIKAVYLFLDDRSSLEKSNALIAAAISRDIGRKVPPNILTEHLNAKQLVRIEEALKGRKVKLDLAVCNTASKIKKALKGKLNAKAATVRCQVEVTFSDDAVTVGNETYPIQRGSGVPRIHVGKSKLNVDVLRRFLCNPR